MRLEILPHPCKYMFTLMNFAVIAKNFFRQILQFCNTRNRDHLHRPTANLSCFQKRAYSTGISIFNSLPSNFRSIMNEKAQFKVALKRRYLNTCSFYSVEEFLTFKNNS
jgi:hypothetical protein